MKSWMMFLPMACVLAACGRDDTPARAADRDQAGAAENASKLTREAAAGSPSAAASRPEVVLHEGDGGVVDSIHVRRGDHVQTLKPSANAVAPDLGVDRISTPDLDFDGHAWLEDAQAYVYIVRERRGSRLGEVSRDTLADAELRAGPSWDAEQQD